MTERLTTLKVKCPHCQGFLKDKDVQLDGYESIKMNISSGGKNGEFWISSVYGSNSFKSNLKINATELVDFSCPLCSASLNTQIECSRCGAPMAQFHLSNGGIVNFCTRQGCNNNSIEFPEESKGSGGHIKVEERRSFWERLNMKTPKHEQHIVNIVPESTYLHSYCPHCLKSLSDKKSTSVKVKTSSGDMGFLILSPFLNNLAIKCTLNIPDDELLKDIACPYCHKSLVTHDHNCHQCDSPVAELLVPGDSKLIHYHICTKKGCNCHGLTDHDIIDIKSAYVALSNAYKMQFSKAFERKKRLKV